MKILSHRKPVANGAGTVKMIPVESDDLWVVYNLIAVGDKIRAPTASKAAGSSTGDVAVILMQEGLANLLLVDQFLRHLLSEAQRRNLKSITENKSKIILAHSSSGFKHSLKDLMDDPSVRNMIKDTKAAMEVRALKEFFAMLSKDQNRVCYGTKHVEIAHERLAVQTLLITDELFRNSDVLMRQKYVKLVDSVKDAGGFVHIFSSMHVSGEQLAQLTGIAAILRFPLLELEDIEM
ncbi:Translation release factor pelota-like protein [Corchorus capsularis]|uniref:Translation release factor pelota-like protein n=1 Tax=Corchorus capsularis TaxID=210143 RepID=A0A1R3G8G9_COCAP|nr:Translation release factor pelota-like protein [Corchorus capsularis]